MMMSKKPEIKPNPIIDDFIQTIMKEGFYEDFAKDQHEFFKRVVNRFKEYTKHLFEQQTAVLHQLLRGNQALIDPAVDALRKEFQSTIIGVIKANAQMQVDCIKHVTDAFLGLSKSTDKKPD